MRDRSILFLSLAWLWERIFLQTHLCLFKRCVGINRNYFKMVQRSEVFFIEIMYVCELLAQGIFKKFVPGTYVEGTATSGSPFNFCSPGTKFTALKSIGIWCFHLTTSWSHFRSEMVWYQGQALIGILLNRNRTRNFSFFDAAYYRCMESAVPWNC